MLNNALEYEEKKALAETYTGYRRSRSWVSMNKKFNPAEAVIPVDSSLEVGQNPYLAERRGDDNKSKLLNPIMELSTVEKLRTDAWNAIPFSTNDVRNFLARRDDSAVPPPPALTALGGRSLRKKRDKRSRRTEKKLRKRKNTYYKRYK